jgi:16S rRNA (adenine1518-N6/adenine1519-N6)-dimethyltransferase
VLALVDAGARGAVARAVVMVQREMAQRIVAPPGSRTYGRLTVAVAQHAEARVLFHVRPGSFHPAPAVTSSVLSLAPRAAPLAPVRDPALFEAVVKQAFATRRKMLRGALARAVRRARVDRGVRGQRHRRDETRRAALGRRVRAPRRRACDDRGAR